MKSIRTIMINGIRYYSDRPHDCSKCYFWKNNKAGCILGKQNCYYLAETYMTEQEKKCKGCPYAKGQPCVSAVCYKDLRKRLQTYRSGTAGQPAAKTLAGGTSYA